jgi:uncharacterized protein (DUF2236 family)
VHLVETISFLNAYQHLSLQPLSASDCNRYMVEMNKVGEMLGATNLPVTFSSAIHEMSQYEPELVFDQRTRETLQSIESYPVDLTEKPFFALILGASFDIVPQLAFAKTAKKFRFVPADQRSQACFANSFAASSVDA